MSRSFAADDDLPSLETPRLASESSLSIAALARFEFEAGKGNEGTKILMVEWEDDDISSSQSGSWHVSWHEKTTVLPADEQTSDSTRRFYFLLPPGTTVPPVISLTYTQHPNSAATVKQPQSIQINPLPAIFPPELGATARTAGKKGVLHTIWAKKRLQALEREIKDESLENVEGVALQMAIQEKEWIETNYGVSVSTPAQSISSPSQATPSSSFQVSTPVSPTGGRSLGDKLKGLKLETSEKDLTKRAEGSDIHRDGDERNHLLSPETSDVAISSFNSFRHAPQSSGIETKRIVSHQPPPVLQKAQNSAADFGFMDTLTRTESTDSTDGLFAKALSPRTPDIPLSPFSFSKSDTRVYVPETSN